MPFDSVNQKKRGMQLNGFSGKKRNAITLVFRIDKFDVLMFEVVKSLTTHTVAFVHVTSRSLVEIN
jgi:hypothetical protein